MNKTVRGDWTSGNIGSATNGELPNLLGYFDGSIFINPYKTAPPPMSGIGVFNGQYPTNYYGHAKRDGGVNCQYYRINFNAFAYSSAYQRADNIVIPSSLTMRWIIKY